MQLAKGLRPSFNSSAFAASELLAVAHAHMLLLCRLEEEHTAGLQVSVAVGLGTSVNKEGKGPHRAVPAMIREWQ
jgi:hypothetical protein